MNENFSRIRGHLENIHNILSSCSQKFDKLKNLYI
ncbi:hypothetical protein RDI58_007349 [Solanum bulbocastanum]|uniref:Uncharacterized protein n=1 Tax=Solanum bulbocastanum TaxID=147425 RepID=A0AAN8U0S8_SOLBU